MDIDFEDQNCRAQNNVGEAKIEIHSLDREKNIVTGIPAHFSHYQVWRRLMSFSCFDSGVIFEEVTNKQKGNILAAGITEFNILRSIRCSQL